MSSSVATAVALVHLFLGAFHQPTVVLTNLCWSKHRLVDFSRQLTSGDGKTPVLVRHVESLREINEVDAHHVLILLNVACSDIEEEISASSEKFNDNYRWLLLDTAVLSRTEQTTLELFDQISILQASQIYFLANHQGETFDLRRVYRNSPATELIQEHVLRGNLEEGTFNWTSTHHQSVAIARQQSPGLAGALVNASLVITHNDSLNHLTDYVDKHLDTISKVNYILTNDIIVFMNATVQYSVVSSWGYLNNETGQWDGMIGELVRGEAQVGASALFFTADRVGIIQYLSMTSPTKSKFVFQAPKLSYTENVFLLPFGDVRGGEQNRLYTANACSLCPRRMFG